MVDFDKIDAKMDEANALIKSVEKEIHDEYVRVVREYGEMTESGPVLNNIGMEICGDWKCITYVTALKLIDDCCLKCDCFYASPNGPGEREDDLFESRFELRDRIFYLKRLIDLLSKKESDSTTEETDN